MKSEPDHTLERLRDEAGTLEQQLLRSALDDRPAPEVFPAALATVLQARRRQRERRLFAATGAAIAVAAAAALVFRGPSQGPKLVAELPVLSRATPSPPAPSNSLQAPAPLAPCSPPSVGSGREPLIDDFEDGDTRMAPVDKRAGYWIAFNDGTGKQEPRMGSVFPANRIPGGRGASRFGLHTSGGRFSKWGAVVAAELNPRRCYDASAYAGLTFWARGRASVRVVAKMTHVVGEEFGGSCVKDCFDGHGALHTLTREWTRYVVRWEELAQRGFGAKIPFDPRSLYSIEFAIPEQQATFDVWLDDVAFLER